MILLKIYQINSYKECCDKIIVNICVRYACMVKNSKKKILFYGCFQGGDYL